MSWLDRLVRALTGRSAPPKEGPTAPPPPPADFVPPPGDVYWTISGDDTGRLRSPTAHAAGQAVLWAGLDASGRAALGESGPERLRWRDEVPPTAHHRTDGVLLLGLLGDALLVAARDTSRQHTLFARSPAGAWRRLARARPGAPLSLLGVTPDEAREAHAVDDPTLYPAVLRPDELLWLRTHETPDDLHAQVVSTDAVAGLRPLPPAALGVEWSLGVTHDLRSPLRCEPAGEVYLENPARALGARAPAPGDLLGVAGRAYALGDRALVHAHLLVDGERVGALLRYARSDRPRPPRLAHGLYDRKLGRAPYRWE